MNAPYDICVIGGGPAGASAAITAARAGIRVLLLERGSHPRHKVCGEFVSHEGAAVLRQLLPTTSLLDVAVKIDRARIYADGREVPIDLPKPGTSVSRYELDDALWRAAIHEGVDCRTDCEALSVSRDSPFTIDTRRVTFTARVVINASGCWSRISQRALTQDPRDRWVGLKAHFREPNPSPTTDLYFFEDGYCGVQPIAQDKVNVCALVRSGTATTLEQAFQLSPQLNARNRHWTRVFDDLACAPVQFVPLAPAVRNVFNAGDSAAFVDPFAGDGISLALRSGALAARFAINAATGRLALADALDHYAREYHNQFRRIFQGAAVFRRALTLPPVARTAILSAMRLPPLAQFAVRMTRG